MYIIVVNNERVVGEPVPYLDNARREANRIIRRGEAPLAKVYRINPAGIPVQVMWEATDTGRRGTPVEDDSQLIAGILLHQEVEAIDTGQESVVKPGPGRPRQHPVRWRVTLELPPELVHAIDALRGSKSRAVYVEEVLCQYPSIDRFLASSEIGAQNAQDPLT